jgi:hypothetical protein
MRLVWYQRPDGLWNAECACNAAVAGIAFERRAEGESAHFDLAQVERKFRAERPDRFVGNQIPACGPKLPAPNPNLPDPPVFA